MKPYGHAFTALDVSANNGQKCQIWLWQIGCGWAESIIYSEISHLPCAYSSDEEDQ